jgi:membrane protein DedA with SNARE-associated domain
MLGLMIEIIPSEIVLAYAGFLVEDGKINFVEAIIFGTIGGVIAQIFVYWVGRYGGRPFVEKYGKYILIKKKHIDSAENWFNRYGTGVIFTARFIPVVRHAISIPAGMARMPLWRFTAYTTLAIIPWSVLFVWLGQRLSRLGKNWKDIGQISGGYTREFLWGAIGLLAIYFIYKLVTRKKNA